jgi:hypothetical protein
MCVRVGVVGFGGEGDEVGVGVVQAVPHVGIGPVLLEARHPELEVVGREVLGVPLAPLMIARRLMIACRQKLILTYNIDV